MSGLSLEQPIFGANYIRGKVSGQQELTFELKFNKGATEFAQPPSTFSSTPDPSSYYQTPVDNVYQPNYPVGFVLPTVLSNSPTWFHLCDVPPPYPGIVPPSAPPASMDPAPGMSVVHDPVSPMPAPGFHNGAGSHPPLPGLNIDNPPTYDEATKKSQ
ncbi:uncharacterized protein LOC141851578 [Brevipalpus obovatus]|uniref:uncharacterized protein LOC141851578 n=1 Tax=Brevipalpus obovatus TaxID=246614 RepID=UPI003D9FA984